jgi:hypothetical protein
LTDFFSYQTALDLPVIGLEAEFVVLIDDKAVEPEEIWRHPNEFISIPLLRRTSKSSQLPSGGALYFDKGVIEVVTPVIEIAPSCTTRVVRSLWEQITFVRGQLTEWGARNGHDVRLQAFSCHYNISFELSREERGPDRTIQKLALLLAYLVPVPMMILATNRRSTGIGVRPRRDRIEFTLDFTPDPGMMLAAAAFIVGAVREVISWPSYRLEQLEEREFDLLDVDPGRHTSRKGWLTKDYHFDRSPFTSDLDEKIWVTRAGHQKSLREIALGVATHFRHSIEVHSDPFSTDLLFAILEGRHPSLLDLDDRPAAYDDIGRLARWGATIADLHEPSPSGTALDAHMLARLAARNEFLAHGDAEPPLKKDDHDEELEIIPTRRRVTDSGAPSPWNAADVDRRSGGNTRAISTERRVAARRSSDHPSPHLELLERSMYERVFINLATKKPFRHDGMVLHPAGMKGWYEAVLVEEGSGEERIVAIDELRKRLDEW